MKKLLLGFVMMATWIVGCETSMMGCYGHWVESNDGARSGHKRGTIWSNRHNVTPYRQCVEKETPHKDLDRRPYG